MTIQATTDHLRFQTRNFTQALMRGMCFRCPACGQGSMFRAFLKVGDFCPACGEALHHHRADDAPAYFNIMIVGHIVVPLALAVETAYAPPYWVHFALWAPLTLGFALGLLQPTKGAIVAVQWAHRMHGFDLRTAAETSRDATTAERSRPWNAS